MSKSGYAPLTRQDVAYRSSRPEVSASLIVGIDEIEYALMSAANQPVGGVRIGGSMARVPTGPVSFPRCHVYPAQ